MQKIFIGTERDFFLMKIKFAIPVFICPTCKMALRTPKRRIVNLTVMVEQFVVPISENLFVIANGNPETLREFVPLEIAKANLPCRACRSYVRPN